MPRQPEGRRVAKIKAYLVDHGAFVAKIHGSEYQEEGLPDFMGCYLGYMFGIEVKQPGETATPKQLEVMRRIDKAGGFTCVATDVSDATELLRRIRSRARLR